MCKIYTRLKSKRGNAMVLSALILLSLTSVGVVSIQQTNTDLMVAGNVSRAAQAHLASESGMIHAMMQVGAKPQEWTKALTSMRSGAAIDAAGGTSSAVGVGGVDIDNSWEMGADMIGRSSAIPDPGGAGRLLHLPVITGMTSPLARMQQDAAFDAKMTFIRELKGMPGWQTDAPFCFEVFEFNARGGVPGSEEMINETLCDRDDPNCRPNTVVVQNRARVIAGPAQCSAR